MDKKIKLGLDLHGVCSAVPEFFSVLSKLLVDNGHEVHIITGMKAARAETELATLNIKYTDLFSVTDHHSAKGTQIYWDEDGNPHLNQVLWESTKGEYCKKKGIDLHLDDSEIYWEYFTTPYAKFINLKDL